MAAVIDNPKTNILRNNIMFYQQQMQQAQAQAQAQSNPNGTRFGKMDLSSAMIQRVARAPTGCGGCGK